MYMRYMTCVCQCACACACVTALSIAPTSPTWRRGLVKWVGLDLGVNNSHVIENSINTAQYMYIGRDAPAIKRFIKYKIRN